MSEDVRVVGQYVLFYSGFPSNWYQSDFTIDGVTYNCVEQYMMAEKARTFGDTKTLKKIMKAKHPKEQKKLGREVDGYDEHKWDSIRYSVVVKATEAKYTQNEHLKKLLLETGEKDAIYVEASPTDKIWGIGLDIDNNNAANPGKWLGKNLLGKAITEVRNQLIADKQMMDRLWPELSGIDKEISK